MRINQYQINMQNVTKFLFLFSVVVSSFFFSTLTTQADSSTIVLWNNYTPLADETEGASIDVLGYTSVDLQFDWQGETPTHTCQYAYTNYDSSGTQIYYSSFLYFPNHGCVESVTIPIESNTSHIKIDAWTPPSGSLNATVTLVPPTCTVWTYSDWSVCSIDGQQTRSIISSLPVGCDGGSPSLTQTCTPSCTEDVWGCDEWGECQETGEQTRTCNLIEDCELIELQSPETSRSCNYVPLCYEDVWECGEWAECSQYGNQTRSCTKTFDCPSAETVSPTTSQSCTYTPPCTEDTWGCASWSECAPNGLRSRTCTRTYDCSSVETAPPATSEFCQSSSTSTVPPQSPSQSTTNQSTIIKSTVKLLCPVDYQRASQGSGTVIDSLGTILTNKHVVEGTLGCLVGFIDSFNDEPYFGARQIADIDRLANHEDIAVLKLRNPNKTNLDSIGISNNVSSGLNLGEELHIYGYPAQFGDNITFTSGDFSGIDGSYLKTSAILEYGNSGGGAYTANGKFMGIPSAVESGELNSMGYILSIDSINAWMNNSSLAYTPDTNSYSRVSLLEDIDLNNLDEFQLYIPGDESLIDDTTPSSQISETAENSEVNSITKRLLGYILLQVESKGEAHYVDPVSKYRYYLKDGDTAYAALRKFGLGITDNDLAKIPVGVEKRFEDADTDNDGLSDKLEEGLKTSVSNADSDGDGVSDGLEVLTYNTNPLGSGALSYDDSLADRVKGRILLQVESKGEAWYLNPVDGKRYYMKNGYAAYQIMRYLSLGITNSDLADIIASSL